MSQPRATSRLLGFEFIGKAVMQSDRPKAEQKDAAECELDWGDLGRVRRGCPWWQAAFRPGRIPYSRDKIYRVPTRVLIEMMAHGSKTWESLGVFTATPAEAAQIRAVMEGRDPYDALDQLPRGTLLYDTLDICRSEGHDVRLSIGDG